MTFLGQRLHFHGTFQRSWEFYFLIWELHFPSAPGFEMIRLGFLSQHVEAPMKWRRGWGLSLRETKSPSLKELHFPDLWNGSPDSGVASTAQLAGKRSPAVSPQSC